MKYMYIVALMLFACENDQEIETPYINPYDVFMEIPNENGSISFYHGDYSDSDRYLGRWLIGSSNSKTNFIISTNDTSFITPSLYPTIETSKFGGRNVSVEFKKDIKINNFYIPKPFELTAPKLLESNYFNAQTEFKWSIDTENTHPLLITIVDTNNSSNHLIYRGYIKDSGTYKFDADLFKNMQSGSSFFIRIERYNFSIFSSENYKLHANSTIAFDIIYLP